MDYPYTPRQRNQTHCWVPKSAPILRNLPFYFIVGLANNEIKIISGRYIELLLPVHMSADSPLHFSSLSGCRFAARRSICHAECPGAVPPFDPTSCLHEETLKHRHVIWSSECLQIIAGPSHALGHYHLMFCFVIKQILLVPGKMGYLNKQ